MVFDDLFVGCLDLLAFFAMFFAGIFKVMGELCNLLCCVPHGVGIDVEISDGFDDVVDCVCIDFGFGYAQGVDAICVNPAGFGP